MNSRPEGVEGVPVVLAALLLLWLATGQFLNGMVSRCMRCAGLAGMSTAAITSAQGEDFTLM